MHILLDTHILLWHLEDDVRLPNDKSQLIEDPSNSILVSVASFWEIAIKSGLGKLKLTITLDDLIKVVRKSTFSILLIEPEHTIRVEKPPYLHKDPFDRMLAAQALTENISVMSVDGFFEDYGVRIVSNQNH